jgi:hypothetical protein
MRCLDQPDKRWLQSLVLVSDDSVFLLQHGGRGPAAAAVLPLAHVQATLDRDAFELSTARKTFTFKTPSPAHAALWVDTLRKAADMETDNSLLVAAEHVVEDVCETAQLATVQEAAVAAIAAAQAAQAARAGEGEEEDAAAAAASAAAASPPPRRAPLSLPRSHLSLRATALPPPASLRASVAAHLRVMSGLPPVASPAGSGRDVDAPSPADDARTTVSTVSTTSSLPRMTSSSPASASASRPGSPLTASAAAVSTSTRARRDAQLAEMYGELSWGLEAATAAPGAGPSSSSSAKRTRLVASALTAGTPRAALLRLGLVEAAALSGCDPSFLVREQQLRDARRRAYRSLVRMPSSSASAGAASLPLQRTRSQPAGVFRSSAQARFATGAGGKERPPPVPAVPAAAGPSREGPIQVFSLMSFLGGGGSSSGGSAAESTGVGAAAAGLVAGGPGAAAAAATAGASGGVGRRSRGASFGGSSGDVRYGPRKTSGATSASAVVPSASSAASGGGAPRSSSSVEELDGFEVVSADEAAAAAAAAAATAAVAAAAAAPKPGGGAAKRKNWLV